MTEGWGGHGEREPLPDYDDEISPETMAAIRALVRSEREVSRRRGDDNGLSEYLHNIDDVTPHAAAARVRAFLDWKGEGYRSVGPSLNFGDLRILVDAVAPITGE